MTCECCRCSHSGHAVQRPPPFIPYHRAPDPPLPANTLILPSTASVFDVPHRFTAGKRSFSISSNSTSAALLDALYWHGDRDHRGDEAQRGLDSRAGPAPLSTSCATTASATSSASVAVSAASLNSPPCICRCRTVDGLRDDQGQGAAPLAAASKPGSAASSCPLSSNSSSTPRTAIHPHPTTPAATTSNPSTSTTPPPLPPTPSSAPTWTPPMRPRTSRPRSRPNSSAPSATPNPTPPPLSGPRTRRAGSGWRGSTRRRRRGGGGR